MAAEQVFADTSVFFFALVARRDRSHAVARSALEKLTRARRPIVTTDYVIDETQTLTRIRTDPSTADAPWARIEGSPSVRLEFVGLERFSRAVQFFRRHADHGYSFTDRTSVVLMQELALTDVLTTVPHFAEGGLRPLLPVG